MNSSDSDTPADESQSKLEKIRCVVCDVFIQVSKKLSFIGFVSGHSSRKKNKGKILYILTHLYDPSHYQ